MKIEIKHKKDFIILSFILLSVTLSGTGMGPFKKAISRSRAAEKISE
jgi:hypothetical protein